MHLQRHPPVRRLDIIGAAPRLQQQDVVRVHVEVVPAHAVQPLDRCGTERLRRRIALEFIELEQLREERLVLPVVRVGARLGLDQRHIEEALWSSPSVQLSYGYISLTFA